MAGVELGMSRTAVQRRLGKPNRSSSVVTGENGDVALVLTYRRRHLTVEIQHTGVTRIETDSRKIRTRGDLGVGSTQRAVARKLHLRCSPTGEHIWCTTRGSALGDPQTVFVIAHRRVARVRVVTITP
jgi:hypothetical protein